MIRCIKNLLELYLRCGTPRICARRLRPHSANAQSTRQRYQAGDFVGGCAAPRRWARIECASNRASVKVNRKHGANARKRDQAGSSFLLIKAFADQ
jgi:hypothetical protein